MDYHSLKRKELQALCKKHNIPANSANSVLADKLSALLNEKQKPITRQRTCMKSTIETAEVNEHAASKRQKKKVRFSPSNDLVEYALRSGEKQKDMVTQIKARRKSVAKKVEKPVVDNNTAVELVDDSKQVPVKVTRSRLRSSEKDVLLNNEKKQSKSEAKDVKKETVKKETDADIENVGNVLKVTRSKAHTLKIDSDGPHEESRQSKRLNKGAGKTSESVGETVVNRARVTRSKAQNLMEGGTGPDVNPRPKKKSGKQAETEGQNVEPSKENLVPVRATRSRRQALNEDIGNAVTNPPAVKKRTRKEMKATDLSSNSRHVAPVDKKEPPKRKSLRTRGVRTVDADEGDKVEVVKVGRFTRSKAPLEMEASGRNSGNKANKVEVQQLDEPSKRASKKNVNRRKSVLQPEKTEAVLHLEEPVNRPSSKNTRRKPVMQKATLMVESPSVGKKQSKGRSSDLSVIESSEDKENVIRSGKDASENEFKDITTGSPKSRKRKGTPIIKDQIIETEYKSPKSSTRSASKSEEKSVAKKQVESCLKKSVSRMNNQSSVANSSKGKSSEIRSGAIIRESTKKRAKLSGTKQSDLEVHDVSFSKEGTPVANMGKYKDSSSRKTAKTSGSKMLQTDSEEVVASSSKEETPVANTGKFKIDEELTEAEVTPDMGKSGRRFTRGAIRSERMEPRQSAIKEQSIAGTRLTSLKVANFIPDPAVNTAPGRITRRGIKHGGKSAGSFSEKVGKMKQTSRSAHKKQSLDDAQMASIEVSEVEPNLDVGTYGVSAEIKQSLDDAQMSPLEVAEVGPNTDVKIFSSEAADVLANPDTDTTGAGSETSKVVTGQMLGDVSASESVRSPNKVVETSVDIECASPVSGENVFGELLEDAGATIVKSTYEASATTLGKFSRFRMTSDLMTDVVETIPDEVSDGLRVSNQNEEAYVESGIFSEAVNLETSVLESERPDAYEKETELTVSGSTSKGLQTDVMIEEPLASAGKAVVMEECVIMPSLGITTKGNNGDDDNNCDSISYDVGSSGVHYASVQQSDVADDGEQNDEDGSANAQKPLMSEPVYEDRDVADGVVAGEMDSVAGDYDDESNRDDTLDQLTVDNKLHGNDTEVDIVTAHSVEHGEPSTGVNVIYGFSVDRSDVADDTGKQLAEEREFEVVPSASNNIHDIPIFAKSEGDDGSVDAAKESETDSMPSPGCNMTPYPLLSGGDGEDDGVTTIKKHESNPDSLPDIDEYDASLLGKDEFSIARQPEPSLEPSSADNIIETHFTGKDSYGDCDNAASDRKSRVDDGGSELDRLPNNYNPEEDGGGDMSVGAEVLARSCDQELEQMLNVAVDDDVCDMVRQSDSATGKDTPKTVATSGNDDMVERVDDLEESALDINKDLVSSILGDTHDMDAEDDCVNEQRLAESDEGCQPEERVGVSSITKDSFPITYNKAKSPVDDTDSDLPTVKEDDTNKQEETRNADTSVDWGDYDLGMDEFEKPISANGSAEVVGKGKTDSALKSMFATPAATRISCVKVSQEDAVDFANQDKYSSLKSSSTTPATTQINHAKNNEEDAVDFACQDHYSSMTPAGHVKVGQENALSFGVQNPCETQSNALRDSENKMYGVPSLEHDPFKLFGEEVGGSTDRSRGSTHFEFKDDQVDQIKQFEFLNAAVGTSHLDPSGFKDKSTHSGEFGNENES